MYSPSQLILTVERRLLSIFVLGCFCSTVLWSECVVVADDAEHLWLDMARASITDGEILEHASVLADDILEGREAGSRGGRAAAKYIVGRLKESGLEPAGTNRSFLQPFRGNSQNILAMLPGTDPAIGNESIVIGAHYDHVGYGNRRNSFGPWGYIHNGADDNASGVAALLEIIDALKYSGFQPRRTILFAFWDGEEKGLLGSKHWVRSPTLPLHDLKLAINVDMVGRLREGNIQIGGTRTGKGLRRLMSSPRLFDGGWLDFTWDYKENSDHWTFYQASVPSMYVHTGVHDDYHRPSDDVEKLNIEGIGIVSRYLVEQICELADVEALPTFRMESHYESPSLQSRKERELAQLESRLGFIWKKVEGSDEVRVSRVACHHVSSAGLRGGDRIVSVNDRSCSDSSVLPRLALQEEKELHLQVLRNPNSEPLSLTIPLRGTPVKLGLSWREDPAEPGTVYITRVVPHSPASQSEMKLFDRIYGMGGESISGQDELLAKVQEKLSEGAEELSFDVESRGRLHRVVVPLEQQAWETADVSL